MLINDHSFKGTTARLTFRMSDAFFAFAQSFF